MSWLDVTDSPHWYGSGGSPIAGEVVRLFSMGATHRLRRRCASEISGEDRLTSPMVNVTLPPAVAAL